jgi:hypothetical protein
MEKDKWKYTCWGGRGRKYVAGRGRRRDKSAEGGWRKKRYEHRTRYNQGEEVKRREVGMWRREKKRNKKEEEEKGREMGI